MVRVKTCRICGEDIQAGRPFTMHVQMCKKRPSDDVLRDLVDNNTTLKDMQRKHRVSVETLRKWLTRIGEENYRRGAGHIGGSRKQIMETFDSTLVKGVGFMFKKTSSCDQCPAGFLFFCQNRYNQGMWVWCEAPTRTEVEGERRRWSTSNGSGA